jgi:hypothetical protein
MSERPTDELEPNERETAFLARARRGFAPSNADAARVSAAVAKLTVAPLLPTSDARSSSPDGFLRAGWLKLVLAGAFAAGTGVAGYHAGFEAGRGSVPPIANTASTSSPPFELSPQPELPIAAGHAAKPGSERPRQRQEPARSRPNAAEPASPKAAPPRPAASSLEEETRTVARIERALRDDNARFALGLLGELDRTIPGGQLNEERAAARVIAHCQLGSDAATALAREFTRGYPKSAYHTRIAQTCGAADTPESVGP